MTHWSFFIQPFDLKQELVAVMDKEVDHVVKRGILVQAHTGYVPHKIDRA